MLTLRQITDRATWTARAPSMRIGDRSHFERNAAIALGGNKREDLMGQLRFDGYFHESGLDFGVDLAAMAKVIRDLSDGGVMPVFAFIYDEFWLPFHALRQWYTGLLDDYALMPAFWAWNLRPRQGEAGWAPHRDNAVPTLMPDGSPQTLTTWIPLTSATPLNGCMYVLPASVDPVYGSGRESGNPLDLPSIRALPAEPGDVLMWNHAVLHWGGRSSPRAPQSRVSIAFELQRKDAPLYNGPVIPAGTLPTFEQRLKLIGDQVLRYRHMYNLSQADAATAQALAAL